MILAHQKLNVFAMAKKQLFRVLCKTLKKVPNR